MRDDVYGRDDQATRAAVLKILPIGSRIDAAKSLMEAKGFHCQMEYNQPYVDDGQKGANPPANFLWCDSGERAYALLVSKRWQVIFVDKDDLVASVAVGVGLTGM